MSMAVHEFKVKPGGLDAYAAGMRRALLVPASLELEAGDEVLLSEYDELSGVYPGPWLVARVTHAEQVSRFAKLVSVAPMKRGEGRPRQRRVGLGEDASVAA